MENTGTTGINYLTIRVPKYWHFKSWKVKSEITNVLTHLPAIRLMEVNEKVNRN